MATKISVYREAARLLGEVRFAALTDDLTARYAFDDAWQATVEFVLRQAYWNFALRTVVPDASAVTAIIGYTNVFDLPCDWLRTHALFVPHDALGGEPGHEYPFDCRFQAEQIHTNVTPVYMRYISSDAADPELWPEHFSNAVAARLAYETAERITGNPARTDQMFQLWGEALSRAAPVDAVPVNPWLVHQLDGTFETSSRTILQAGNWRFALKSATLTAEASPAPFPGFSSSYAKPADWARTQALFALTGLRESPIDSREHEGRWSASVAPTVRYVSSDYLDARTWPEDFRRVVVGHLGIDLGDAGQPMASEEGQQQRSPLMWPEYLKAVLAREGVPESPWLRHQFDGSFMAAARSTLEAGLWRFAMKSVSIAQSGTAITGFTYAFPKPADWLKTQGLWQISGTRELPLDAREAGAQWSANVTPVIVRYLSTDGLTPTTWPAEFERVVAAYLGIDIGDGMPVQGTDGKALPWPQYLAASLAANALPVSPWLQHQFDGSFTRSARYMLEQGFWRFAMKTSTVTAEVTPDPISGFDNSFVKPADWLRTQAVFTQSGERECPLDCREQAKWHADAATIVVRYLSSDGLSASLWSEPFTRAVAAHLGIDFGDQPATADQKGEKVALWPQYLVAALQSETIRESPWLIHQFDGAFVRSARFMLEQGAWKFATKTAALTAEVTPAPQAGFTNSFAKPADWFRAHAIFATNSVAREVPIDARDSATRLSANVTPITVRYVSSDGLVATTWPEEFTRVVAAHLGIDFGDHGSEPREDGQAVMLWPRYLEAALGKEALAPNQWLPHQLDGTLRSSARFVLEAGNWRFAMKSAALSAEGSPDPFPGFSSSYAKPADWLRTQAVFQRTGTRETPMDAREHKTRWSANAAPTVRYVSTDGLDPTLWPEDFLRVVGAHRGLSWGDSGAPTDNAGQEQQAAAWPRYLAAALQREGVQDSPWLKSQFDGTFRSAAQTVLEAGLWRFALKSASITASGTAMTGFTYAFPKPADWLKTQAAWRISTDREIPVDLREHETQWSATHTPLVVRYLSSSGLDPTLWPEQFTRSVAGYLGIDLGDALPAPSGERAVQWPQYLERALDEAAEPVSRWLPKQLDGSFAKSAQYVLQAANWRFALKSVLLVAEVSPAPFPGFTASYAKPADWVRTQALFLRTGSDETPMDAREHGIRWSGNVAPTVRYVSTDGLDATLWPEDFMRVVAAHLGLSWGDVPSVRDRAGDMHAQTMWPQYLATAIEREAIPESPWLRFQFNGALYQGVLWLLDQANWRFAIKTVELEAIRDAELLANVDFDADSDWTKGTGWTIHSGEAHKAAGTGSDLSQAETLTAGVSYELTFTVSNYVAGTVTPMFTGGTDVTGTARSADGTYTETLTALTGNITALLRASATADLSIDNVSLKQVTAGLAPSPGYDYAFAKPADHGRTFHLFRRCGADWRDIDFRDEEGRFHANYDTIVLRYVATGGETSSTWSDGFKRALLAYLEFEEAKRAPDRAGAQMMAREAAWKEAFKNARIKDDLSERPRWNEPSRLVRARMGGNGRFGMNREMGW